MKKFIFISCFLSLFTTNLRAKIDPHNLLKVEMQIQDNSNDWQSKIKNYLASQSNKSLTLHAARIYLLALNESVIKFEEGPELTKIRDLVFKDNHPIDIYRYKRLISLQEKIYSHKLNLELAKESKEPVLVIWANLQYAFHSQIDKSPAKALDRFNDALKMAHKFKLDEFFEMQIKSPMAIALKRMNEVKRAQILYEEIDNYCHKVPLKHFCTLNSLNLAALLLQTAPRKSLKIYQKSNQLAEKLKSPHLIGSALRGLGNAHKLLGNIDAAIQASENALKHFKVKSAPEWIADTKLHLATLYSRSNDLALAYEFALDAQKMFPPQNNADHMQVFKILSELNEKKKDYKKALDFYRKSTNLSVELLKKKHSKEVSIATVELGLSLEEEKNRRLKNENDLKELKIASQRLKNSTFLLISAGSLVIIYILVVVKRKNYELKIFKQKEEAFELQTQKKHAYLELEKLVYPHQLNLIQQGNSIESTMPTGVHEACVICFDVQNSSRLGHLESHKFFKTIMEQCHKKMMENYRGSELVSDAYMIKDLGDGFLCSVGFPFQTRDNIFDQSYHLSVSFVKIFQEVSQQFFQSEAIYCGVGIAFGKITGIFPRTGIKHYDILGDAVVKATRYEAFRKEILGRNLGKGDIILIQDKVYHNLDEQFKSQISSLNMENGLEVKDDPEASTVYFQFVSVK